MRVAKRIAPRTSEDAWNTTSSGSRRSSAGRDLSRRKRRKTFSTPMIASSTSAPIAIVRPPSVIVLSEPPTSAITRRPATTDKRNRDRRDEGRSQVAEKEKQDHDHENAALTERGRHVAHGDLDEVGLAEVLLLDHHAVRQGRRQLVEHPVDLSRQLEGVGSRAASARSGSPPAGCDRPPCRASARLRRRRAPHPRPSTGHRPGHARPPQRGLLSFEPFPSPRTRYSWPPSTWKPAAGFRLARRRAAGHFLQGDALQGQHGRVDLDLELPHVAADRHHL